MFSSIEEIEEKYSLIFRYTIHESKEYEQCILNVFNEELTINDECEPILHFVFGIYSKFVLEDKEKMLNHFSFVLNG